MNASVEAEARSHWSDGIAYGRLAAEPQGAAMPITLNHTIVPARDKDAAARFFARLFDLPYAGPDGYFAPVRVSDTFESHHYAFHVTDAEFDAVLGRVEAEGLAIGSAPWSLEDGKLNDWNGGRGFYFTVPDGHLLELMTVPQ